MAREKWTDLDYPEEFDKMPVVGQRRLLEWITLNLRPIKTFNPRHTSYGLKHHYIEEYVTNGQFKGAMLRAGYKVKDKNALNWEFNVSQRSPAFHLNQV